MVFRKKKTKSLPELRAELKTLEKKRKKMNQREAIERRISNLKEDILSRTGKGKIVKNLRKLSKGANKRTRKTGNTSQRIATNIENALSGI